MGLCYRVLCTNLSDRILYTLSRNHNIYREKWCLSVINNVCFEVKKCFRKKMYFPMIWRPIFQKLSPQCPNNSANNKETQCLGKNSCREKCLDKSLIKFKLEPFNLKFLHRLNTCNLLIELGY